MSVSPAAADAASPVADATAQAELEEETAAVYREVAEGVLSAVGHKEDAERLLDLYLTGNTSPTLGVITEAGIQNIRRHVEENIPPEEQPVLFVDLGSGDAAGVLAAAMVWRSMQQCWGVELSSGRHRTAITSLDELWTQDPDAARKCCLLNDDVLSVPPLLSMKAVFWVSNLAFDQELNNLLAAELDRYVPEGALIFSGKPLPMERVEPCPGGDEVLCPQSWDPSLTAQALRVRGPAPAAQGRGGELDFPGTLRRCFEHFGAPARGVQVLATKAAAAVSEALLQEAEPEGVTALLWSVAGAGERRLEAEAEAAEAAEEREELLAELQEEAEALGLPPEALRAAYGELEHLEDEEDEEEGLLEAASPWRREWHGGVLDGVAPWQADEDPPLHVSWGTFEELGFRARRLLHEAQEQSA